MASILLIDREKEKHKERERVELINNLDGIQGDGAKAEPRVKAVQIGDAALIVVPEGRIDADDAKGKGDQMKGRMHNLPLLLRSGEHPICKYCCILEVPKKKR